MGAGTKFYERIECGTGHVPYDGPPQTIATANTPRYMDRPEMQAEIDWLRSEVARLTEENLGRADEPAYAAPTHTQVRDWLLAGLQDITQQYYKPLPGMPPATPAPVHPVVSAIARTRLQRSVMVPLGTRADYRD